MRLDLDPARVEADERVGEHPGEHAATLGDEAVTCLCQIVTSLSARAIEHVFEVLAGPAARAAVHVAAKPLSSRRPARSRISG